MTEHGEATAGEEQEATSEGVARPVDPVAAKLYDELRALARRVLAAKGGTTSVQATELVHECYLRLARLDEFKMLGKAQFMALSASLLRGILVDLARRRDAARRGGGWIRTTLARAGEEVFGEESNDEVDLLDLDTALKGLRERDWRAHTVVELKFFAGLSGDEIAEHLGVSRRTVTKEWTVARAWLRRELRRGTSER